MIYVGSYRPNKGQLDFLRIVSKETLGPYNLEFFGVRQADVGGDDYAAIQKEVSERWQGKVTLHSTRLSHEQMVSVMSRASGLIHFSNGDRNPRVLYEALMFGLPVMVSIQSMPYIGLQCQPFVTLTVTCGVRFFALTRHRCRLDGVRAAPDTRHRRGARMNTHYLRPYAITLSTHTGHERHVRRGHGTFTPLRQVPDG